MSDPEADKLKQKANSLFDKSKLNADPGRNTNQESTDGGKLSIEDAARIESQDLPSGDPGLGTPPVSEDKKEQKDKKPAA